MQEDQKNMTITVGNTGIVALDRRIHNWTAM